MAAVSEGVKLADGRYVCELTDGIEFVDAFGHKQLTGTARFLAEKINREVGCKTRAIEFNFPSALRLPYRVKGGYYGSLPGRRSCREGGL